MGLAQVYTRCVLGIDAHKVAVETHISGGLPKFSMVGLAAPAMQDSKERVRSAILNSQFKFPASRITVNLAPANLHKTGAGFDLAIALSILAASAQIVTDGLDSIEFCAELGLCGRLKPVPVILPHALALWREAQSGLPSTAGDAAVSHEAPEPGHTSEPHTPSVAPGLPGSFEPAAVHERSVVSEPSMPHMPQPSSDSRQLLDKQRGRLLCIAPENVVEAGLCGGDFVVPCRHLLDVTAFFAKQKPQPLPRPGFSSAAKIASEVKETKVEGAVDQPQAVAQRGKLPQDIVGRLSFQQIQGQLLAKKALLIAAAGGHNLLMIGPPGVGKTVLANCLSDLLPALSAAEALEIASIYACSQQGFNPQHWRQRPMRSPHHTSTYQALVGGGNPPWPGEISLAHHGVLFLDELPEFSRSCLEALRQPLESRSVTISRAAAQVTYPAAFQLIAAMNPCPCGYTGSRLQQCRCSAQKIQQYQHKLSGPLLDRIDIKVILSEQDNLMPFSTASVRVPHSTCPSDVLSVHAPVGSATKQQGANPVGTRTSSIAVTSPALPEGAAAGNLPALSVGRSTAVSLATESVAGAAREQLSAEQQLEQAMFNTQSAQQLVQRTRCLQLARQGELNCQLLYGAEAISLNKKCEQWLHRSHTKCPLSGRSLLRLLRAARTIADLEQRMEIATHDLAESFSLLSVSPWQQFKHGVQ